MYENLPMKKETGIFSKIKTFFKFLFFKKISAENVEEHKDNVIIPNNNVTNTKNIISEFKNSIKSEVNNSIQKEIERNALFEKIRKNPELIDILTDEQLKKLSVYYDTIIEKNKEIIESKKEKISKLKKVC